MKRFLTAFLCLLIITALTACNSGPSPSSEGSDASSTSTTNSQTGEEIVPIRVALFTDGNDMSASQKSVFDAFVKDYPNIHPTFEYITSDSYGSNWNGYLMKIQTMIAGEDAPACAARGLDGVAMLVMNDMALPINDYVDSHEEAQELLSMQNEDLMKIFTVDGNLYSIPYEANCVVTHINKDIFAKAGIELPEYEWTWDDFVQI